MQHSDPLMRERDILNNYLRRIEELNIKLASLTDNNKLLSDSAKKVSDLQTFLGKEPPVSLEELKATHDELDRYFTTLENQIKLYEFKKRAPYLYRQIFELSDGKDINTEKLSETRLNQLDNKLQEPTTDNFQSLHDEWQDRILRLNALVEFWSIVGAVRLQLSKINASDEERRSFDNLLRTALKSEQNLTNILNNNFEFKNYLTKLTKKVDQQDHRSRRRDAMKGDELPPPQFLPEEKDPPVAKVKKFNSPNDIEKERITQKLSLIKQDLQNGEYEKVIAFCEKQKTDYINNGLGTKEDFIYSNLCKVSGDAHLYMANDLVTPKQKKELLEQALENYSSINLGLFKSELSGIFRKLIFDLNIKIADLDEEITHSKSVLPPIWTPQQTTAQRSANNESKKKENPPPEAYFEAPKSQRAQKTEPTSTTKPKVPPAYRRPR